MAVDWSAVLNRCSPVVKKTILETRSRHEELKRLITETRNSIPKFEWDSYSSKLKTNPQSLSSLQLFKDQIDAFQPIIKDTKQEINAWEKEKDEKVENSIKFVEKLKQDIANLERELVALKNSKPIDEMTVEEIYEIKPELKTMVDDAIRNDCWSTEPNYVYKQKEETHH